MTKMKGKLVAIAIVAVTFDCHGKSGCARPHLDLLPLGQKKKC